LISEPSWGAYGLPFIPYNSHKRGKRTPHRFPNMQTADLFTPCQVGDLRLPPKFKTVVHWLYCDTAAGHPTRAWLYLPAGMIFSLNCDPEQGEEIEIWACGPLSLTRPMSDEERADWLTSY